MLDAEMEDGFEGVAAVVSRFLTCPGPSITRKPRPCLRARVSPPAGCNHATVLLILSVSLSHPFPLSVLLSSSSRMASKPPF